MDAASIQVILDYVTSEWRRLRNDRWADHEGEQWPIGIWICQYEPLHVDAREIDVLLNLSTAWFLDSDGVRQMDTKAFVRFWVVTRLQPWATGAATYPHQSDFSRVRNRIGVVTFAPYQGRDEIYLETNWGETWARGQRVAVRDGHVDILGDLWMA